IVVKEFMADKKTQRERVNSDQRCRSYFERFNNASEQLIDIYKDVTGERAREIDQLGGPNEFAEFYSRLKLLKEVHRRNPDEEANCLTLEFEKKIQFIQNPDRVEKEIVKFSDEEGYGKYLDMHLIFEQYRNLKCVNKLNYITFIDKFDKFEEIPRETAKKSGAYKEYLAKLLEYILDFISRAKPLTDVAGIRKRAEKEFEILWAEGKLEGWNKEKPALANPGVPLDLDGFESAEQLEALGGDRIKSALIALGLKCGGTPKERAIRLFSVKSLSPEELEKEKPKKSAEQLKEERRVQYLAKTEFELKKLAELLSDERQATKENVERKQARIVGEEEEVDDQEEDVPDDVEDDDVPYNPKNLPLGWDGKPIPYWLYKLHGLNISYTCEICGNQVYKGPKAFQRHFTEWRHSHGMRCLGIPNTAHFANITKIQDALDLWNKMSQEKESSKWDPNIDEEYEDSKGNILNRRTYEDLKRQNLL
ncbi:UNVERIFIED_CONTAM: Splicing factor 3A subunit 3, partial [Eudyptes robustus]